jgi:sulfatase maturation enzyme AslB (radical SAM superfamily)
MKKFKLSSNIILRREWFGCIVFNFVNDSYYQFNKDAFLILKEFQKAVTFSMVTSRLKEKFDVSKNDIRIFAEEMIKLGIITDSSDQYEPMVYHLEVKKFRRDCLVSPTSVTIYITDYCPKSCRHCVTKSSPIVSVADEKNLKTWEIILRKLRDVGVCSLVITGGEALTRKDIFEVLKIADDLKFSISLLTDYDNLTDRQVEKIKEIKYLNCLQTSLDGGVSKTHDFIRGKGSFVKTLKRLKLFKDYEIDLTVSTSIFKKNLLEMDQIADICSLYGVKYWYVNPITPHGRAKDKMQQYLLNSYELKQAAHIYVKILRTGKINTRNRFWLEAVKSGINDDFNPFKESLRR